MSQRFQVHLRGIIDLLSHHLYSGPEVFLRELLQNACDAIAARRQADTAAPTGAIEFEVIPGDDTTMPTTLIARDNGIGLTPDQIERFLATIGESSKRDVGAARDTFIGQFGIGLLSCFAVTNEIVAVSKSAVADAPAVEWRGNADGSYTVRELTKDVAPGTTIFIRARDADDPLLVPDRVRDLLRRYGQMLDVPVDLITPAGRERINGDMPIWKLAAQATDDDARAAILEAGGELLGTRVMDYFPLSTKAGDVEGVAFILSQPTTARAKGVHRVYLKGMLISEAEEDLLPGWAVFVRCVVSATRLKPVASREAFVKDRTLERARAELGNVLRQYLVDLAEQDPARLFRLVDLHHQSLRTIAAEDETCFRAIGQFLPFETSLGTMTLETYCKHHSRVLYVATRDEFRQIAPVAAAQQVCVINAGYAFDRQLMLMLARTDRSRRVQQVTAAEFCEHLQELSDSEQAGTAALLDVAGESLDRFDVRPIVRKFEPASLPALITMNDDVGFRRSVDRTKEKSDELWAGLLDAAVGNTGQESKAVFCFNNQNPLVHRLRALTDRELVGDMVELLYLNALMLGHHPMTQAETSLLNDRLLSLLNRVADMGSATTRRQD